MDVINFEKNPIIFYGAGGFANTAFPMLSKRYNPVCFCDSDISKQGQKYMGLPVLSLVEVVKTYAQPLFYITTTDIYKPEVIHTLIGNGIEKERIINYEPYQKYISCPFLESHLRFSDDGFRFCCSNYNKNESPLVPYSDTIEHSVLNFLATRNRIIDDIQNTSAPKTLSAPCEGCEYLSEGYWLSNRRIQNIGFIANAACQYKCSYCKVWLEHCNKNTLTQNLKLFKYLDAHGMIGENAMAEYASGEIAIQPNRAEVLEEIGRYNCAIFTNAGIFCEEIAHILETSASKIVVSMDSGTKETFEKIKGIEQYNKVCENIKAYAQKGMVELKYIILPGINDNDADFDGFIQLCEDARIKCVSISRDSLNMCNFSNENINKVVAFLGELRKRGIFAKVNEWGRDNEDYKRISALLSFEGN